MLGLRDRGHVREGLAADLVIFDPATVGETNSFEQPKRYPAGIRTPSSMVWWSSTAARIPAHARAGRFSGQGIRSTNEASYG
jgi:N-acyl-D-aspartate/D-glutamate deacylase